MSCTGSVIHPHGCPPEHMSPGGGGQCYCNCHHEWSWCDRCGRATANDDADERGWCVECVEETDGTA